MYPSCRLCRGADLKVGEGTRRPEDFEEKRLNDTIEEVEGEIRCVVRHIAAVEEDIRDHKIRIRKEADKTTKEDLLDDLKALEKKEDYLREKERQLREKERQLRENKLILLKQKPELAAGIASLVLKDLDGWATFGKIDSISISSVNSTTWRKVARAQHLTFKTWNGCLVPSHRKWVESFGWDDRQESAQSDRYLPYLQSSIITPRSVCWVNGNSHKGLLTVEVEDLPFKLKGTTDAAICTRLAVSMHNPTLGLRVLFELKKEAKQAGQFQALAALVCANILCPDFRPVLVYTDLNNDWQLYWIDASTLYGVSQERAVVIGLVEDLLIEGDDVRMEDATVRAGDGARPFLDRRKILGAARAVDSDTANIGDLEGMLPQEEITHGQQLLLLQELCNIPAVWQMYRRASFPENQSIPGMSEEPQLSPPRSMYL